ncbi:hypothetical protein MTR_6g466390 [Medicago truncatula]|uniref:Uncharacterized protein n=1 Tax=Medicago truncatula TaxID=3880 RepID=A0A072ULA5_MEDTR|nr:hypothetical protein MTR_6g466390 [Medicago truncatula]
MCCHFCGGYHCSTFCEEQYIVKEKEEEVVNIDYNTQLQNILDDFLVSNQVSFEKFDLQCGDLIEKAHESQRKLVQMETECHEIVVEENPKVKSVDIFSKTGSTGVKEITRAEGCMSFSKVGEFKCYRFNSGCTGACDSLCQIHEIPSKQEEEEG